VDIASVDTDTFDLSVKNPDGGEEVAHRTPQEILECKTTTYGEETVVEMQQRAVYVHHSPLEAQQIEQKSGYRCRDCGKEYCKDCLEKKAPGNSSGGKSCPSCRGRFDPYGETTVPAGLSGVTAIAAGSYHSLALKSDGTVVAWGGNMNGQTTVPVGLSGVTAISAGAAFCLAIVANP
jgi:alpha-tubulin suppressor-like RCC1 family protein